MVCHHQPADAVCGGQVGGLAGQSHLDAGGPPGDEVGQLSLPDPLQALVNLVGQEQKRGRKALGKAAPGQHSHECQELLRWFIPDGLSPVVYPRWFIPAGAHLRGIHLPLDDVEDGDVAVVGLPVSPRGHHHVFGLQQPSHHIQNRGFPHAGHLQRAVRVRGSGRAAPSPSRCPAHARRSRGQLEGRSPQPRGWSHVQKAACRMGKPQRHTAGTARLRAGAAAKAPPRELSSSSSTAGAEG